MICVEVLEHCVEPWVVGTGVESIVKPGGVVLITTPFGPWEPQSFEKKGGFAHRNHIWSLDRYAYRVMYQGKPNVQLKALKHASMALDGRNVGNFFFRYNADHKPLGVLDPIHKAKNHRSRQALAAAVIAYNNEDTILQMLHSLNRKVQGIQIALGPSTDNTRKLIEQFAAEHPWIYVRIIDVPKIEAPK